MDFVDVNPPDTHSAEVNTLFEIARRLKVWASEVERPASYILQSLGENLSRCATRLLLVATDLAISKLLAEEQALRTQIILLVEELPVWAGPWYFQNLARLAAGADFMRRIKRLTGPLDVNG
jgi:hypothetical protein